MSEVLVLVDHVDGAVRRTTAELLTLARRLGEPSAVFVGTGVDAARSSLRSYGAEKVYVLDDPELGEYLVVPKVDALAANVSRSLPRTSFCFPKPTSKTSSAKSNDSNPAL